MVSSVDTFIGSKIREARLLVKNSRGGLMTQTELGDAVGVSFQQIQKYENGTNRISSSRLWKIAEVLGHPINYFFEELADNGVDSVISDSAIVTAKMLHELPEGEIKKQVYKLIQSFHSAEVAK